MNLFNEQLPFEFKDIVRLKVEQDGHGVILKAVLVYVNGEGEEVSWTTNAAGEIEDLRDICEFGNLPVEITVPAHLKPKAAAFPLQSSLPNRTIAPRSKATRLTLAIAWYRFIRRESRSRYAAAAARKKFER